MPLYHFCFCWQSDGWLEGLDEMSKCMAVFPSHTFTVGAEMHQKLCPFFFNPPKSRRDVLGGCSLKKDGQKQR